MEKVYSGVEMVPARLLKVQGQGVHICAMPLYTKTTSHSRNNIGIMLGVFKKTIAEMSEKSCPILYTVCPGSSDPPEKILNIFASENEVYTVF